MQVPLSQKPCPEQKSESRAWSTPTELFRLQEPVRSGDRAAAHGVPNGDARECKGAHGVNSRPTSSRHRIHISPGRCRCRAASSLEGRSAGNTCHRSNPDRTYTCHLVCRSREHCSRRCHCSRALQKQALSKNDTTGDCVLKATKTCGVPLEQSSPEKPSTQTH